MSENIFCAIDIGGTKILVYLIDRFRRIRFKQRLATPAGEDPEVLVNIVNKEIGLALQTAKINPRDLCGIGICIAALVDFHKGIIYQAPNLGWNHPVALKDIFKRSWSCPVYVENDANAAVQGEVYYGAARGHHHAIYVTVSTGIGGGLFLDGHIYRGSSGFAGEIGHIKPFGKGRTCGCGGLDCLEAWASGKGIAGSAGRWREEERDTARVFARAEMGHSLARQIIDRAAEDIATGLANLVTVLNPGCLVLGGTVIAANQHFFKHIRQRIKKLAIKS
ncbi:MAG TPA: ROK family protein, partial [Firmicutes bacterium]|nr:ROK family protein [Bacillota bacterium]